MSHLPTSNEKHAFIGRKKIIYTTKALFNKPYNQHLIFKLMTVEKGGKYQQKAVKPDGKNLTTSQL